MYFNVYTRGLHVHVLFYRLVLEEVTAQVLQLLQVILRVSEVNVLHIIYATCTTMFFLH